MHQPLSSAELLGYLELQVGSVAVQVPIRAALGLDAPAATFAVEGDACAILVRSDTNPNHVPTAIAEVAEEAVRHLSRKLLN